MRLSKRWTLVWLAGTTTLASCNDTPTTITDRKIVRVEIRPGSLTLALRSVSELNALAFNAGGDVIVQDNKKFTWVSSAPNVVSVGREGHVSADGRGSADISATYENLTGVCRIVVKQPGRLAGRVVDAVSGDGVRSATIVVHIDQDTDQTTTDPAGYFTTPEIVTSETVFLDVSATGYVATTFEDVEVIPGVTTTLETIPLVPHSATHGGISGTVLNARDGGFVANATVKLFAGMNSTSDLVGETTTNAANGTFHFDNIAAGTYTLSASAGGFADAARTGIAVGNNQVVGGQDVVLSPFAGSEEDVRVVLTWGDQPPDLDSHLTGPQASGRFHVFYRARGDLEAPPFAALDLDDTSGRGPETVSIRRLAAGTYRYSVHDFTHRDSTLSAALAASRARVEVYRGNSRLQQFAVPNGGGTLWTVFEMFTRNDSLLFTPLNVLSYQSSPDGIQKTRLPAKTDAKRAANARAVSGSFASRKR